MDVSSLVSTFFADHDYDSGKVVSLAQISGLKASHNPSKRKENFCAIASIRYVFSKQTQGSIFTNQGIWLCKRFPLFKVLVRNCFEIKILSLFLLHFIALLPVIS
jgi:hypothetical protein